MRSKFLALYPLVLFIAAAGLLLGGSYFRVFDIYEYQTYDWRFRMRPAEPQSQDIVLIEILDDALEKLGRQNGRFRHPVRGAQRRRPGPCRRRRRLPGVFQPGLRFAALEPQNGPRRKPGGPGG